MQLRISCSNKCISNNDTWIYIHYLDQNKYLKNHIFYLKWKHLTAEAGEGMLCELSPQKPDHRFQPLLAPRPECTMPPPAPTTAGRDSTLSSRGCPPGCAQLPCSAAARALWAGRTASNFRFPLLPGLLHHTLLPSTPGINGEGEISSTLLSTTQEINCLISTRI